MRVTIGFIMLHGIMCAELPKNVDKKQACVGGLMFLTTNQNEYMQKAKALGMVPVVEVKADPENVLSGYDLYWVEGVSKDWQDELRLLGPMVMDNYVAKCAEFKAKVTGHPQMIDIAKQFRAKANESIKLWKLG